MENNKEITVNEIAHRLQQIILLYFKSQTRLHEISGVPISSINRICAGKKNLTSKMVIKLQETAGINANYLLSGIEPMMITSQVPEKSYQTKYHGILPIKAQSTILDLSRSVTDYYVLVGANKQEYLDVKGKADVVNIAFDGIVKPFLIAICSIDYCNKYNLPFGSDIVVSEFYEEGHTVLAMIDNYFIKAKYTSNRLIDKADCKEYLVTQKTKIVGQIYYSLIKES
jgi:hypothetical protein